MRNRRLVLIGLIILVVGVAAALLLPNIIGGEPDEGDGTPTPTPMNMTQIVVSAQNIRRGQELTQDAVILQEWPIDAVPLGALTALENAYDKIARQDIARGMPVTESVLAYPGEEGTAPSIGPGSDASWMIPEGRVAYPIPVTRYTSVAWALKPGDHVDVLLSLSMVDMDEEFHTVLPNQVSCFSTGGEDGQPTCPSGPMGRFEVLPNGALVNVLPSGEQIPRLVTQLTVQNAIVLRVGDWRTAQPEEGAAAPEVADGGEEEEEQTAQETQPAQRPVTLAVSPQDAAVLEYAWLSNARVTLLLRRAGDEAATFTDPVTLQYVLDTYNIDVPSKLPYGLAPSAQPEPPVE